MIQIVTACTLLVAALVDVKRHLIPNGVPMALLVLSMASVCAGRRGETECLLSILFTGILFLAIALVLERFGGSLGGGDVKLLATLAGVVGFYNVVMVALAANVGALLCLVGYKVVKRSSWSAVSKLPLPMAPMFFAAYLLLLLLKGVLK